MAIRLRQDRLSYGARGDQLARADQFGEESAIIRYTQESIVAPSCGNHGLGLSEAHGRWLLTQNVLPRIQRGYCLRRVEKDRGCNVDGVHRGLLQRVIECGEHRHARESGSLLGIACENRLQSRTRFLQKWREEGGAGGGSH